MVRLREWWEARAPRERIIMAVGGAALAIAIGWAYVWDPIANDRTRLIDTVPRLRVEALRVSAQGAEVDQLRAAARARGPLPPAQAAVEEALKTNGLGGALAGVTSLGEGRVQVSLRPVAFDALVRSFAHLAQTHGMAVDSIALKAAGEPGKVQVENLVLRAARSG
jgi:general secretion pathway protein M